MLAHDSIVRVSSDCISTVLADETVILSVADGTYYGTKSVGTLVWRLLETPRSVAELRERIVAEFDVDERRCEEDLLRFLGDLHEHGLVDVVGGAPERVHVPTSATVDARAGQ